MAATTNEGTGPGSVDHSKTPIYNGVVKTTNLDSTTQANLSNDIRSMIVYVSVVNATVINEGDFLYLDTDNAKPANLLTWNTDLTSTQISFVDKFLGIAKSSHASGDGDVTNFPVDISPFSIITAECDSETHEIGDKLTLRKDTGNNLKSNTLRKTATTACCVARCIERNTTASATVKCIVQSAYWGINDAGRQ
jgi:hypothetical protein